MRFRIAQMLVVTLLSVLFCSTVALDDQCHAKGDQVSDAWCQGGNCYDAAGAIAPPCDPASGPNQVCDCTGSPDPATTEKATLEPTDATAEPTDATREPTGATLEPTEATPEPTHPKPECLKETILQFRLPPPVDPEEGRAHCYGDYVKLKETRCGKPVYKMLWTIGMYADRYHNVVFFAEAAQKWACASESELKKDVCEKCQGGCYRSLSNTPSLEGRWLWDYKVTETERCVDAMCPSDHPHAFRKNYGYDYCCSSNIDSSGVAWSDGGDADTCQNSDYVECPGGSGCADYSSGEGRSVFEAETFADTEYLQDSFLYGFASVGFLAAVVGVYKAFSSIDSSTKGGSDTPFVKRNQLYIA